MSARVLRAGWVFRPAPRAPLGTGALCLCLASAAWCQTRAVLIDLDGVRRDTLENSYLSGSLPNFARVLGAVRDGEGFGTALWFESATSVLPSVTMSGPASMFTGVPPSRHGIPGNQGLTERPARSSGT